MARTKAFDRDKAQAQAMQLFWRKGYNATSIEDLVETLQLSRSSLYDTFGDKRTLFLTVLRQYSQQVIGRISSVVQQTPSAIQATHLILDDVLASAATPKGALGCFMVNSVAELVPYDADVMQIAAAYAQTLQQILTQTFTHAIAEGTLKIHTNPEHLAIYVFNTIQGMRLLIKSGATQEQLRAVMELTLASLV